MKQLSHSNSDEINDFQFEDSSSLIPKIVIAIFIVILNICVFTMKGQLRPEAGFELTSSGNSHGAFYSVYGGISKGSHSLYVGGLVNKRELKLTGVKITYSKNLTGSQYIRFADGRQGFDADPVQINFFSYLQYVHNAKMCSSAVRYERATQNDRYNDFENLRMNTGEAGSGIEFRVNFTNNIAWRNVIGAAVYYHFNYTVAMSHEKIAPALLLSTGLNFTF